MLSTVSELINDTLRLYTWSLSIAGKCIWGGWSDHSSLHPSLRSSVPIPDLSHVTSMYTHHCALIPDLHPPLLCHPRIHTGFFCFSMDIV